jgi:uncharacterized protein YcbK (DUF882 family)
MRPSSVAARMVRFAAAPALCALVSMGSAHAEPTPAPLPPRAASAATTPPGAPARAAKPRRAAVPSYGEMVRKWHAPPKAPAPLGDRGLPLLVLEMVNTGERLELAPQSETGGFQAIDVAQASHALRDPRADAEDHPMDPRLLDLAYRVQRHFVARSLRVVSGFRLPHGRSNHGRGRALDVVVPGTPDQEVARFVRTLGFVGVGFYPRSGFVHIDSRARSYFWVDASGPGQRGRQRPVLSALAAEADRKALANGEAPPADDDDSANDEAAHLSLPPR